VVGGPPSVQDRRAGYGTDRCRPRRRRRVGVGRGGEGPRTSGCDPPGRARMSNKQIPGLVHQRPHLIPGRARLARRVPTIQHRGGVPPLLGGEEPIRKVHGLCLQPPAHLRWLRTRYWPGPRPGDRCLDDVHPMYLFSAFEARRSPL
jgi:hypothetical protein